MSSADLVVIGGGPAGLAASLMAARRGLSVMLVEASERLGGMAASITISGQRVDLGSHRLHPSASPASRHLLDDLLGSDLQVRPRRGRLRMAERWVAFPLQVGDLLRSVPPAQALAIVRDLATGPLRRESPDDTYADVIRARLGPTVLDTFHGPYATKLWDVPAAELAGDLARRRVALRGGADLARKLLRAARPEGRTFLYPRLGYGQIVDRMFEEARLAGVQLLMGSRPTSLAPQTDDNKVVTVELSDGASIDASRVFWTAPPTSLLSTVRAGSAVGAEPRTGPDTDIDYRGVVLVYLTLDLPQYTPFDAHYVPDPQVAFVRLSEPKNYRDGPDPAGSTVLCAEVPATPGDRLWDMTDGDLGALVLDGMDRLGLPAVTPSAVQSIRLPRVYPRYGNDEVRLLRRTAERAAAVPGVTVFGRQGLEVIDNLHHVLDMARLATACLGVDGDWDAGRWEMALTRFRTHVVED